MMQGYIYTNNSCSAKKSVEFMFLHYEKAFCISQNLHEDFSMGNCCHQVVSTPEVKKGLFTSNECFLTISYKDMPIIT